MAQVINTNIPSLNTQRHLGNSQAGLATALQRLSSGLRINSAKDDAAGLAISERMSAQINGMNQAARNANDGISLMQTAEGAVQSAADILQRIRTLAVQSANASNSASDRQALQREVGQLTAELDRMARTTEFNGKKLLDGSFGSATFQVGANAGQTITAHMANLRTHTYGNNQVETSATGVLNSWNTVRLAGSGSALHAPGGTFTGNGTPLQSNIPLHDAEGNLAAEVSIPQHATAAQIAALYNAQTATTGVEAQAATRALLSFATPTALPAQYTLQVSENGVAPTAITFELTDTSGEALDAAVSAFNAVSATTGIRAARALDNDGLVLTMASGGDLRVERGGETHGAVSVRPLDQAGEPLGGAATLASWVGTYDPVAESWSYVPPANPAEAALVSGYVELRSTERFSLGGTQANNVVWGNNGVLDGRATLHGHAGNAEIDIYHTDTAQTIAARINNREEETGIKAEARTRVQLDFSAAGNYVLELRADNDPARTVSFSIGAGDGLDRLSQAIEAFADISAVSGVYPQFSDDGKSLWLTHPAGQDVMITSRNALNSGRVDVSKLAPDGHSAVLAGVLRGDGQTENVVVAGAVTLDSYRSFSTSTDWDSIMLDNSISVLHPVSTFDISTVEGAERAIKIADAGLDHINSARARFGAVQSRFETTISNLSINVENTSASRSRIQDADFAQETAALARQQILQQAGVAMLAQANALPQQVLALLNG